LSSLLNCGAILKQAPNKCRSPFVELQFPYNHRSRDLWNGEKRMLKPRAWQILKLAASCLVIVAVVFAVWLAVQYYEPNKREAAQEANGEAKAVEILSSERVAYYTKVLSIFTGVLSAFGLLQILFLIRADETARRTAEAAKASADASMSSERAWLILDRVKMAKLEALPVAGTFTVPHVYFGWTNKGRSVAWAIRGKARFILATAERDLPLEPDYGEEWKFADGIPIVPQDHRPEDVLLESGPLTEEQLTAVRQGEKILVFFGYIEYHDIFKHRTCASRAIASFGMSLTGAITSAASATEGHPRTTR